MALLKKKDKSAKAEAATIELPKSKAASAESLNEKPILAESQKEASVTKSPLPASPKSEMKIVKTRGLFFKKLITFLVRPFRRLVLFFHPEPTVGGLEISDTEIKYVEMALMKEGIIKQSINLPPNTIIDGQIAQKEVLRESLVKIKSQITGKLMRRSPKLARFAYKNFELLSWVLIILTVVSFGYSAYVSYNLVAYGSCDPDSGSCIFNPEEIACGSESCAERGCDCDDVGCESPEFKACEGNCSCQEQVCG